MGLDTTWITPPTMATGNVLGARTVNAWQNNLRYLFGVASTPMFPFAGVKSRDFGSASIQWSAYIRHYAHCDKLECYVQAEANITVELHLVWNSIDNVVAGPTAGPTTFTGPYDITTYGITAGDWYRVYVKATETVDSNWLYVGWVAETPSDLTTGWTTPPTFTDGNTSAAANFNTLTDDLAWLKTRYQLPPQSQGTAMGDSLTPDNTWRTLFWGRHLHVGTRLAYNLFAKRGYRDDWGDYPAITLYYNGKRIHQSTATGPYTAFSGTIDLTTVTDLDDASGLWATLAYNTFYPVELKVKMVADVRYATAGPFYLYEDFVNIAATWYPPAVWQSGDYGWGSVGTRRLQYLSDDLTWLKTQLANRKYNWATRDLSVLGGPTAEPRTPEKIGHIIKHRARWLHYAGGKADIIWSNQRHGLDDPGGTSVGVFDLDSLSWLPLGADYRVVGDLDWACEDYSV